MGKTNETVRKGEIVNEKNVEGKRCEKLKRIKKTGNQGKREGDPFHRFY